VARTAGKVLYIAADRPRQLHRLAKTMFSADEAAVMNEDLLFCHGFPRGQNKFDRDPDLLVKLAVTCGDVDTIVVDSAKDFSQSLVTDEGGSAFNTACQNAVNEGIEVLVLHHERKASSDGDSAPSLDKIYGSHNLTSGAGSVLALKRRDVESPGRLVLHQVKSAAGFMAPMNIVIEGSKRLVLPELPGFDEVFGFVLQRDGVVTVRALADQSAGRRAGGSQMKRASRWLDGFVSTGRFERSKNANGVNCYVEASSV
jgi:replicative DNA helicase